MTRTIDKLPSHLRPYCSEQPYEKYTARDQAAWRYIMRRSHEFFKDHAVASYQSGFVRSGLTVDRIPRIDDIDAALQKVGWGAVPVVGFIAPWAFIEFQARKILPIACDMRTVDHIAYTPAPDIVHEAAGHAPIIPDKEYSDYLAYYASLGTKALYSKEDLMIYEAVRYLSDIKEKPESTPEIIAAAEKRLKEVQKSFTFVSEQSLVARMSWWTAEYGLMGTVENPKIYGAGLLSSVGESKHAMTSQVKKIPFSIDCINYSYNITEPQPQLFVARDNHHLAEVLHELAARLSYRIGGVSSLQKALESRAIVTTVTETGSSVSGVLAAYEATGERVDFVKFSGPVQICYEGKQLSGHGLERHGEGFSSPLGRLAAQPDRALAAMDEGALRELGIVQGQPAHLKYASGFEVKGTLVSALRKDGKLLILTFRDCRVSRGDKTYFDPSWGEFDLLVCESVPSVYGGPADREPFGEHELNEPETTPAREAPYSKFELACFERYRQLRDLRSDLAKHPGQKAAIDALNGLAEETLAKSPDEWLLLMEIYELGREQKQEGSWMTRLKSSLESKKQAKDPDVAELVTEGLHLIH